jgi:UDP:flavonoid glycosyltransferase YjiC (YdhE family)
VSRILFAWELGGGFGHLGPFLPIARRLIERGHEITLAVREVDRAAATFGALPVRVVQAPVCLKNYGGLSDPPLNYAEILMRYGYLDAPLLRGLVRSWRDLIELTQADAVVADHAPTALLAARMQGVPRVALGSPFAVPPQASPTPNMRPWIGVPRERLESSDATVLANINSALAAGTPRLGAVHEIFDGAHALFTGAPELDPYGPRDPNDYVGLLAGPVGLAPPVWPDGAGPAVFAYLIGEYRHIGAAIDALAASQARCAVYLRDADAALRRKHATSRLAFSAGPVDLDAAVAGSALCVCHGNVGTVMGILRFGRPMLLLPMQLEHFLLASRLENLGIAVVVHPEGQPLDIAGALARALREAATLSAAARAFAGRHREPVDTIVQRAAGRIESLARGGRA